MKLLTKLNSLRVGVLTLVLVWAAGGWASAASVYCQIGMMGRATLNAPLATATGFNLFENGRVGCGTDMFSVPGAISLNTPVTFSTFSFDPAPATPFTIWSFVDGGREYSLALDEMTFDRFTFAGNQFLNIVGAGFLYVDGQRHAPADFCFSTQQCTDSDGTVVTWSAQTTVPHVPEGGTTVIFLISAILGIEVLRRRLHIAR